MTVTKTDLVKSVRKNVRFKKNRRERQRVLFPEFEYHPLSRKRASRLVDALLEIMKNTLEKGEQVHIQSFGRFLVKFKWARKGRNPKTGASIILDSRRIVAFHCSPKLRKKMRQGPSPGSAS